MNKKSMLIAFIFIVAIVAALIFICTRSSDESTETPVISDVFPSVVTDSNAWQDFTKSDLYKSDLSWIIDSYDDTYILGSAYTEQYSYTVEYTTKDNYVGISICDRTGRIIELYE